ncbi:hypothetical protein PAPYR_11563 [Paratrimastix pyriformis]|uniref:Uncharacterized protein n=1 Tax=Paratrimastix pyriformis TaxID=342808 RepID=A0ABQ8U7L1_9EUKA|nr:hypothetical protein PAPYR_11563 [Paratrimastix pyriformis]
MRHGYYRLELSEFEFAELLEISEMIRHFFATLLSKIRRLISMSLMFCTIPRTTLSRRKLRNAAYHTPRISDARHTFPLYNRGADFSGLSRIYKHNNQYGTQVENSPIAVNAAQVDNGSTSIIDNGAYEGADEGAYEFNVDLLLRAVNILESTLFGAKITLKKFTARVTCPAAVEDAINLMKLGVQSH